MRKLVRCAECGEWFPENETVKYFFNSDERYCKSCAEQIDKELTREKRRQEARELEESIEEE